MASIIQQTALTFNELGKELDAISNHLEKWSYQQVEMLTRGRMNHETHIALCQQKIENLAAQHNALIEKRKELEEQLRQDYNKEERLSQQIRQQQNIESVVLPEKLNELKAKLEAREQQIRREKELLQQTIQKRNDQQQKEITELSFYEKYFGMSFTLESDNWLRCCFYAINPQSPQESYSFWVRVCHNMFSGESLHITIIETN